METLAPDKYILLNTGTPIWTQFFTVAPLVVIGTKEGDGYDLAPKHMATPLGFGNYFGFVCTPDHCTYQNVKTHKAFTVSFPVPEQIIYASLSASPRDSDNPKSEGILSVLPVWKAPNTDAPLIAEAYLYLECSLFKIIDGFDENSIVAGKIETAFVHKDYRRSSEQDEQELIKKNPLLAYLPEGRF
ncbi:MAG: flavin reductase, partial [Sinomicrobium sp.]|nr:flavin reductase [Sinomicrobium sp.]